MCLSNSKPITQTGYKVTKTGYKVLNKVDSDFPKFTTIKKRAVKGEMKVGQFYHVKENSKAYYKAYYRSEDSCFHDEKKFSSTKALKEEHGFHVFDNLDSANKLKELIQELKSQYGEDDNKLADGKTVVKKVLCQKIFIEGFQPTNQEELFVTEEDLKNREPNAFRCKKIKILDEGIDHEKG